MNENKKVQKVVFSTKLRKAFQIQDKRLEMEQKLKHADENRARVIEQRIETAKEVGQRRSASKDLGHEATGAEQ